MSTYCKANLQNECSPDAVRLNKVYKIRLIIIITCNKSYTFWRSLKLLFIYRIEFDERKFAVSNKPVENHQIWFDNQTRKGMNFDDWRNVNRQFWLRVLRIVRHSMLPMFRPCCDEKWTKKRKFWMFALFWNHVNIFIQNQI